MTVELLQFDAGETSKTLGTASRLFDQLLEMGLTRDDTLIALGGGVVGDMTGFVASTFLRGIDFIQVPTTTLAAVDSSVGGKTAVNTPRGKNLVGTFHAPKGVFIAVSHLATQEREQHGAGLVEALKMAATLDVPLFETISDQAPLLLNYDAETLLPVLAKSIQLKAFVVAEDEHERGIRAVLNYGHTIGHAIESLSNYNIPHGQAVVIGMMVANRINKFNHSLLDNLCMDLINKEDLKNVNLEGLKLLVSKDKKTIGNETSFVFVDKLGETRFENIELTDGFVKDLHIYVSNIYE